MTPAEREDAVRALLREKGRFRVAIRGKSMRPSIAEPMVMQIGPADEARIGDVLVFDRGDVRIAHRIVAIEADGYRTAGDAQPHIVEVVPAQSAVGRVLAVWSDASPQARRIDGAAHRLRGWWFGRFHAVRRAYFETREKLRDVLRRARPRLRDRPTARLVEALVAARRADADALAAALACEAGGFVQTARRHRLAAYLCEATRDLGVAEQLAPEIRAHLRRARLEAIIATGRMQSAIERTIAVLRAARIDFVLLKGAARVYARAPGATFHPSDDIDVLVRESDVDRSVSALRAAGWYHRDTAAEVRRFRAEHHHAASLFSPNGDFPVEVHHQLAQPGTLSLDSHWETFAQDFVVVDGSAGSVLQLDALGTALHLAIHAVGLRRLRDIALLAALLAEFDAAQRDALAHMVRSETKDRVRLEAAVALAARVADVPWTVSADVERYLRWASRREDLPERLRQRCDAAEMYVARPRSPWAAVRELIPWWSRGAQLAAAPGRILARCATNALAFAYAMRMERRPLAD